MRNNIGRVIDAFCNRTAAKGDSKQTCSTDGTTVYSYAMPIARRLKNGRIQIVKRESGPSRTTRAQIDAIAFHFRDAPVVRVNTLDNVPRARMS